MKITFLSPCITGLVLSGWTTRHVTGPSQLLGTVRAVDALSVEHKALVGQRQGALLAVEAVLMPSMALIVHHIGALAKS